MVKDYIVTYHRFDKSGNNFIEILEFLLLDPEFLAQRELVILFLLYNLLVGKDVVLLVNLTN